MSDVLRICAHWLTGNIDELWREGPQDDLVLAAALAAWMGERAMPEVVGVPYFLN